MGEFYHPLPKTNILLRHENLHVTVGFAQPHGHMYFTFKPHHPILNGRIVGNPEVGFPSLTSDYAVVHKEWTSGQRISRELLVGFAESGPDRIVLICSTKTVSS
jgi:hypothetical protein